MKRNNSEDGDCDDPRFALVVVCGFGGLMMDDVDQPFLPTHHCFDFTQFGYCRSNTQPHQKFYPIKLFQSNGLHHHTLNSTTSISTPLPYLFNNCSRPSPYPISVPRATTSPRIGMALKFPFPSVSQLYLLPQLEPTDNAFGHWRVAAIPGIWVE